MIKEFDINKPWTEDEIKKHKKDKIRNTNIFNVIFIVAIFYLLYSFKVESQYYSSGIMALFIILSVIFFLVVNFLRLIDLERHFNTLTIGGYNKLSEFKEGSDEIKNYLNKVGKQDREIITSEFWNLEKEFNERKKNKVKNEVLNT